MDRILITVAQHRKHDMSNLAPKLLPSSISKLVRDVPLAVAESTNPVSRFTPIIRIGRSMFTLA